MKIKQISGCLGQIKVVGIDCKGVKLNVLA